MLLLFAAAWLGMRYTLLPPGLAGYVEHLPTLLFGLTILLAFAFHRGRILLAAVMLLIGWWAISHDREVLLPLVQILYCFNIMIFIWAQERGLISTHGIWRFGLIGLQFGLFLLLYQYSADSLQALLQQRWLDFELLGRTHLSQPGLLVIVPAVGLIALRVLLQPGAIHGAMFASVLAVLIAGFRPDTANWLISYMSVAAILLIYGLLSESYRMAFYDELTGLPGRRALQHKLATLGSQYTIAMLDIDHFKKFNDTYGHDIGDQVLKMVAGQLRHVGGNGRAYRYGGEEFTIVFPRRNVRQCIPHLAKLRETIEDYGMVIRSGERPRQQRRGKKLRGRSAPTRRVNVTISIGVAERNEDFLTTREVMEAADQALYRAKSAGRNRISR